MVIIIKKKKNAFADINASALIDGIQKFVLMILVDIKSYNYIFS